MNENRELTEMVRMETHRQLHEHFFEQAIVCSSDDVRHLEQMVLDELPSYIQSGIHEMIQVFMEGKQFANK